MALEKLPFVAYKDEEERKNDKSTHRTLRLNRAEQKVLDDLKSMFDVKSDSTMIKMAMLNYHRVLHSNFSPEYIRYLFKKERARLTDYVDVPEADLDKL